MNREALTKTIVKAKNRHILLELPTGLGKSKIAIEFMKSRNITDKILIVIPKKVLKDNWLKELDKWGYSKYIPNIKFVTYISFPKMADIWNCVIFDECHHLTERCREALKGYKISHALLLSATIKRELKYVFHTLIPDLGCFKLSVKDATDEGILPTPEVYLIPLTLDNTEDCHFIIKNKNKGNPICIPYKDKWKYAKFKSRKVIIKCTQKQYYDDISSLIDWYKKRITNPIIKNIFLKQSGDRLKWLSDQKTQFVANLLSYLHEERTITFCNSINQTETLGVNPVNSKEKSYIYNLRDFNMGKINHISACNMLDEGE